MIRIEKNGYQFIGIDLQNYKGNDLVDCRVYRFSHSEPQGVRTKQGLSMRVDTARAVSEAIQTLISQIETPPTNSQS